MDIRVDYHFHPNFPFSDSRAIKKAEIEKVLKPGGILAVAVPNFQSLFVKLLGTRDQGCLWVPEH